MALLVRDVLAKKGSFVASIGTESTVLEGAKLMNDKRIGALVVRDAGNVIGIFTERDILTRVVAAQRDPATTRVGEVMSSPVACCRPDSPLEECRTVMTNKRVRHIPVVDGDKLVGIITAGDVMAQEVAVQQHTIEYLHQYLYEGHR